jgi:hypothetical protein
MSSPPALPEAGAPAAAAKPEVTLPSDVPTFLEEITLDGKPKPEAAKVEEPKPAEPEKKVEAEAKAPEAAPSVDYFKDVKIPETITLADAQRTDLSGAFEQLRSGDLTGGVQKLMDMHNEASAQLIAELRRQQYVTFNETRRTWAAQIAADPEMGGSGFETSKRAIARMRDMFVPEGDRKEFDEFLRVTGAGDHPAFARILFRAARFNDEPRMPPPNPKPPVNIGKRPGGRGTADLYPNTNFAK